ncbi:MAG: PTS sugar transporter subunit IIA [Treponema sp.]|nr:PTS sugar transporter subunit IIA [Treponema sp.]
MTKEYEWITPASITTDLEDGNNEEIIGQLTELLRLTGKVTDPAAVEEAILKREQIASTSIDDDIDAPHALTTGVSEFCTAIGVVSHRKIYILIAWNESNTRNLKLLAVLLELIKNEKQKILAAETGNQIHRILTDALAAADMH